MIAIITLTTKTTTIKQPIATVGHYGGGTTVGGCFKKRKIHYILLLQIIK